MLLMPDVSLRHMGLVVAVLAIGLTGARCLAAETATSREVKVTLRSDGEHCLVRDVTILCSDLASHLRDTLKLPRETIVFLRAGRGVPYQSVRSVLDIIEKSGFSFPVAHPAEPQSSKGK